MNMLDMIHSQYLGEYGNNSNKVSQHHFKILLRVFHFCAIKEDNRGYQMIKKSDSIARGTLNYRKNEEISEV